MEFCPRVEIEKTLTADRVPGQSARKVSWLFKGQVDVKEGAPEALPVMISVDANTQWVLAFTESLIGSAIRAPSFNSTCPLNNQDTLRADCPGARFTVNVFPSTHRGRAQRAPPCKNKASPLQIPAFSVFSRNDVLTTICKVCAFTRAFFLRRREPTSLERTIFFDASSDWGGRGHKNLLV